MAESVIESVAESVAESVIESVADSVSESMSDTVSVASAVPLALALALAVGGIEADAPVPVSAVPGPEAEPAESVPKLANAAQLASSLPSC